MVPPFSQRSVLTGTSLKTFNDAVIQMKSSKCKYELAVTPDTEVVLSRAGQKNEQVLVTSNSGEEVMILPEEGIVKMRPAGSQLQQVPEGTKTLGKLTVTKTASNITIETPSLIINTDNNRNYVLIEAKPWAYNKVRGLVGRNDHERSTDLMTRNGQPSTFVSQEHGPYSVSSESSDAITDSWIKSGSCGSSASGYEYFYHESTSDNVHHCQSLVHKIARDSKCEQAIVPEPFLAMCRIESSPSTVAQAYKLACTKKGIKFD